MNENYQYTEYNEEKNRVPWLRILVSFLILVAAIIIVLLLLKKCKKTSLRDDLIEAAKEYYEKFDNMLKDIDEEYRTTLINFAKYKLVMFTMAKIMEMEQDERNKIALYLVNNVN